MKYLKYVYISLLLMLTIGATVSQASSENLIPAMTSNTSPAGTASASSVSYSAAQPYHALNQVAGGPYNLWLSNTVESWLAYEFESYVKVNKYAIIQDYTYYNEDVINQRHPKSWRFEGWDENIEEWIILDEQSDVIGWYSGLKREYEFENNEYYKKYRIYITENNGDSKSSAIGRLEMYSVEQDQNPLLSVLLEEGEEAQLSVSSNLSDNQKLIWTSSEKQVATVTSNGVVTALTPGLTQIWAENEDGTFREYINVRVIEAEEEEEFRLALDLQKGQSQRLYLNDDFDNIKWSSMDESVVTVSDMGKATAVSTGLAIVTAEYEGETYVVYVRVR